MKRSAQIRNTRDRIAERSAPLLKTSGYLGTPLSEIMRVTGLQKGGLYHYFESRDDIALAAFSFSARSIGNGLLARLEGKSSAREKLRIMIRYPLETYWRGGCPVANLAVEADDSNRKLAAAARNAMDWLIGLFADVIRDGIMSREFTRGNARDRAVRMVAALEGGILLSNLYKDPAHLRSVMKWLEDEIRSWRP
jgi:AcrR family transcriptional regulator